MLATRLSTGISGCCSPLKSERLLGRVCNTNRRAIVYKTRVSAFFVAGGTPAFPAWRLLGTRASRSQAIVNFGCTIGIGVCLAVICGGGSTLKHPPIEAELEPASELLSKLREAVHKAVELTNNLPVPPNYDNDYWRQERLAIARMAAWEAQFSYCPDKGVSLETYAFLRARWAILDEWKRLYRLGKNLEAFPIDDESGEEMEFEDPNAEQSIENHLLCSLVREAMGQLSEEKRIILEMHYGENLSIREIAEQLGRSKSWVHRELISAIEAIKSTLGIQRNEHE